MKSLFSFLSLFLLVTLNLQSQLVLTNANWKCAPGADTLAVVELTSLQTYLNAAPISGVNRTWDLNLTPAGVVYNQMKEPTNPAITGAQFYYDSLFDVIALGRGVYRKDYYKMTNDFYGISGYDFTAQGYFIGDLTMGPTDSITIAPYSINLESPLVVYKFPLTFGTTYSSTIKRDVNTALTIAAYGLNQAPATKRTTLTIKDTVVGWGKIRITSGQAQSQFKDALLIRRETTSLDSILLYGQPAPATLMMAFQLQQGKETKTYRYTFISDNLSYPILVVNFGAEAMAVPTSAYANLAIFSSNVGVEEKSTSSEMTIYPNPATEFIEVALGESNLNSAKVEIFNTLNECVYTQQFNGDDSTVRISITELPAGVYFVKVNNNYSKFVVAK